MSNKVNIKLNLKGLNELMKSPAMVSAQKEAAERVMSSAKGMSADSDSNYKIVVKNGNYINFVHVETDNDAAVKDTYENNTLLKALGSSGLKQNK